MIRVGASGMLFVLPVRAGFSIRLTGARFVRIAETELREGHQLVVLITREGPKYGIRRS